MSEVLTHWLMEYGYWAVFLGAMLEGETAAFLSGVAAHNQLLSYPLTMLFAALGGVFSDNVLFSLGAMRERKFYLNFKSINIKSCGCSNWYSVMKIGLLLEFDLLMAWEPSVPLLLVLAKWIRWDFCVKYFWRCNLGMPDCFYWVLCELTCIVTSIPSSLFLVGYCCVSHRGYLVDSTKQTVSINNDKPPSDGGE